MEKGNEAGGGAPMGTGPKIASGAGAEAGTGTATAAPPPFSEPVPPLAGEGAPGTGGGAATTHPRGEVLDSDGSKLRLDGTGGAEYLDPTGRTARLEGDGWVDPATGQPAAQDLADRATQMLQETELGRRRIYPPS